MRETELRIGNIVYIKSKNKQCTILSGSEIDNAEDMEGILLTEELLKRFGFTLVEQSPFETITLKYWVKNRICLFFNESPPENTWLVGWADQRFGKYSVATGEWITDVHTIQNIFHALTGKELKLN